MKSDDQSYHCGHIHASRERESRGGGEREGGKGEMVRERGRRKGEMERGREGREREEGKGEMVRERERGRDGEKERGRDGERERERERW